MQPIRRSLRAAAGLAGIVSLCALSPSSAFAQTACYVPGSGTVYRIKEANTPPKCSAGHIEFQLAAKEAAGGGGNGSNSGISGVAGGDLGGNYPNPSVVKIQGQPVSATGPTAGQVLTFTNGAWTPKTPFTASIPINLSGAYDLSNVNGLVARGTANTGDLPSSGPGLRFEWIARLAALRAGEAIGTEWDSGKVGYASAAFGYNATASADYSFAAGAFDQATGASAIALGLSSIASGGGSFAAGTQNTTASGYSSVAIGTSAKASGNNSLALGTLTVASGNYSTAMGANANTSAMIGSFVYGDASTNSVVGAPLENSFIVRAQHFWFGTNSAPTAATGHLIETSTGAYLSTGGTWTNTSDVNRKHAFKPVEGESVLASIDSMNVTTWSYNSEADSIRHMGPTAQDFRKAFKLGDTEKAIATVDADGVSLAAIKALIQRTKDLRSENETLRAMLADMARRLNDIEQAKR